MAVNSENLGKQVRCPHCQQVVVAPSAAPPATMPGPVEAPSMGSIASMLQAPVEDPDHIFSPVEVTDDLFGRSEGPLIEMPPAPPALTPPQSDPAPPPEPQAPGLSTQPWTPPESPASPPLSLGEIAPSNNPTTVPPSDGAPLWPSATITETQVPPPAELPSIGDAPPDREDVSLVTETRARRRTEQKTPWFLLLVFCPLLLYAIVISIFAFFLYRHDQQLQEQRRNPFDIMPDVGDDPGVQKGKKVSRTDRYKLELATLPLPEHLCTSLGNPLRIGELEVTPDRVERQRVSLIVEGSRADPCRHDSLVLYLDMKNLSTEYAFAPLDNYFDRYWRPGKDQIPPLTVLEIGNQYRCYGGPARWYPRGDRSNRRQWIQGRHEKADVLQPGEEKQLFVCTDGDDNKAAVLLFEGKYQGSFLWRVRVRRGLVRFQDKDYSATAVLGVRFTDQDIR
jgi:hypothetical protein